MKRIILRQKPRQCSLGPWLEITLPTRPTTHQENDHWIRLPGSNFSEAEDYKAPLMVTHPINSRNMYVHPTTLLVALHPDTFDPQQSASPPTDCQNAPRRHTDVRVSRNTSKKTYCKPNTLNTILPCSPPYQGGNEQTCKSCTPCATSLVTPRSQQQKRICKQTGINKSGAQIIR